MYLSLIATPYFDYLNYKQKRAVWRVRLLDSRKHYPKSLYFQSLLILKTQRKALVRLLNGSANNEFSEFGFKWFSIFMQGYK